MTITSTQVLEMLAKASKLGIHYGVYEDDDMHFIQFVVNWFSDEHRDYSYEKVFITKENESWCKFQGWDFWTFMMMLDDKLKEKKQEEIKAEKRQKLIDKLTSEERELLGLDSSKSVPHKSQMPF